MLEESLVGSFSCPDRLAEATISMTRALKVNENRNMEFLCDRMRFRLGFCLVVKLVRLTPKQALGVQVDKNGYQAVGFPYDRMLKLRSSKEIRIDVPVRSVSWSVEDHSDNTSSKERTYRARGQ